MATASSLRRLRLGRRMPFPALSCCCAARGTGQVPLNDTTGSGPAGADIPWSGSPGPATTPTQTGLILSTAKSGNLSKAYGTHRHRAKTGPSAADEKRSVAGGIFCAVVGTIDVDTSTSFCYDQEDFLKKGGGGVTDRFETFVLTINRIYRCIQRIKDREMEALGLKGSHVMCLFQLRQ